MERISWIDIARGIGILLVLYGHALTADSYRHIIYAFHMPLFFFLSGVVYHHKKSQHFLPFLWKNIKSILLPYFFFALLSYGIWYFNLKSDLTTPEFLQHMYGILYGNSNNNLLFFNVVLWFLPCLFITKVAFELLTRISEKKVFLIPILFFFSLLGYLHSLYFSKTKLFFSAETALTAIVFFGIGYLWNKYNESILSKIKPYNIHLLFFLVMIFTLTATWNFNIHELQVDMRLNRLNNYALFYSASISGIFTTILISVMLRKNAILSYLGKHSLVLFVWHLVVFTYLTKIFLFIVEPQMISLYRNTYLAPLYTVITIIFILGVAMSIKKLKSFGTKLLHKSKE
jgi:acyltransferase